MNLTNTKSYHPLLFIAIFCLVASSSLYGQNDKIKTRTIKINEGMIDNEPVYQMKKFLVKVNPLLMLIGDFPVSLEYAITDWFSAEIALGFTTENYFLNRAEMSGYNSAGLDGTVVPGFSFMQNIKLIPSGDGYDDAGYLFLQYNYRSYNMKFEVDPKQTISGESEMRAGIKTTDWGIGYGYFYNTYIDGLVLDTYLGITMRTHTPTNINYTGSGNSLVYQVYEEEPYPTFGGLLGMRVCYNF